MSSIICSILPAGTIGTASVASYNSAAGRKRKQARIATPHLSAKAVITEQSAKKSYAFAHCRLCTALPLRTFQIGTGHAGNKPCFLPPDNGPGKLAIV